jgi:geranylgeranyl diphosphate synthase type II
VTQPSRARSRKTSFERALSEYRETANQALLEAIPAKGPRYLYDLVSEYPRRSGKGLRAALCLAACGALGGADDRALHTAVAAELFHNGFLIHDDIQDQSLSRRGAPALHQQHGIGIAVNVGNATNLIGLECLLRNLHSLGPEKSWLIVEETHRMMRYSLEGQAIELGWIRDNVCELTARDYLRMCLKKTSWYSFIFPLRVGAIIARGAQRAEQFCRFGWYLGAAFQVQDDILNLTGSYGKYGKEIGGDLQEGKRTLILIHLLSKCRPAEKRTMQRILARPRAERSRQDLEWIYEQMRRHHSIEFARRAARQLAGAALFEAASAFRDVPDSQDKRFILNMARYVVERDH